ncbi:MAG TPA: hypothetical protein VFJ02_24420 [Vicinamibacterales bacterium]|nr:hypothetical protein [Vicinamibacterales bacterium]
MEIFDAAPRVDVDPIEYTRLLGFPRGHVLEGRVLELVTWARAWYAANGHPWVYARASGDLAIDGDGIRVDGVPFKSPRLRRTLDRAGAHGVMLVAVSAGPEIEQQAHRAWLQERPDEYFFLEMYGSAVVEHLTTMTGARLCSWADGEAMAVLPHYSPGYPDWDIAEQQALHALIGIDALPGALDVLESGMLRPKKSLLAVFGITRYVDRVQRLSDLVPCENCSYAGCQFRRVPYGRAAARAGAPRRDEGVASSSAYATSTKALQRWADERLTLRTSGDGIVDALFRYEGTTCSNMGRRLAFDYRVVLGPRDEGYPIQAQSCTPASADDGHQSMCAYLREGDALIEAIAREAPLVGRPLDEVLTWQRPAIGPGCYCEADARLHKWGLVLETIHFALMNRSG